MGNWGRQSRHVVKTITEAALPSSSGETAPAHFAALCPSAGSTRHRPSNKAHLDFKGCLGSPAVCRHRVEPIQQAAQKKPVLYIIITFVLLRWGRRVFNKTFFTFFFFFSFPLREKREERLLWSPTEKRWSSQNQKQITQRIEQKAEWKKRKKIKKKVSFGFGTQQRGRVTKSLFARTVELIKLIQHGKCSAHSCRLFKRLMLITESFRPRENRFYS